MKELTQKYNASNKIKTEYQLVGASLVKNKIKNPELDKYKGEPKDEIEVIIGDKEKDKFVPNIEIRRWNEVGFKIKPIITADIKDQELEFTDNKIKFKTPEMEIEFEDFDEEFKFIWYFNKKPESRIVCFDMENEGLDFFYQPELTQKEIDEGVFRPPEIIGSYAIYNSTKGGMNDINGKEYKVGKVGHIPRPMLYDSNGREEFAERLLIENNQYCVVMSEDFWNNAVYPIKSNDTFGYETLGGSGTGGGMSDSYRGRIGTTGAAGTLTKFTIGSFFTAGGSDNNDDSVARLYDSSINNVGGQTNSITISNTGAATWKDYTWSSGEPDVTAATTYYVIALHEGNDQSWYGIRQAYDSGGVSGHSKYGFCNAWPTMEDFPALSNSSSKYSLYATYSTGGAGTNMEINIGDAWKDVSGVEINIGDAWKTVTKVQLNVGDVWKTIFEP